MNSRIPTQPDFSLAGHLLVAAPSWQDELFGKSVCFIIHHASEGAVGIVLNRCFGSAAKGLWQHLAGDVEYRQGMLHFGGPCSGPVVALHNAQQYAEFQSADGVYLAAQVQNLQALVRSFDSDAENIDLKIIVGQADWAAGQLDKQFASGRWLPLPVSSELVFADEEQMWGKAVRQFGNCYITALTGVVPPVDIQAN